MPNNDPTKNLKIAVQIFVLIAVILALFFDGKGINILSEWFTKIFIGMVYTVLAAAFVGVLTGNIFQKSRFNYKILGMNFNVPITILTFLVKIVFFF